MNRQTLYLVLAGALIWVPVVVLIRPGWPVSMFVLAPLVLVPAGLRLVPASGSPDQATRLLSASTGLQFPAAALLVVAFLLPAGLWAAALAVPWLVVTTMVACVGLLRLKARGFAPLAALSTDAGLVYLAVGGGWAVLSRWGARPMGFSDEIVQLTAVHFHFAGFVLPLLAGLAARSLPGGMARIAPVGVVAGVPLVALGIAFSPLLEVVAACALAGASVLVALLQIRLALQNLSAGARLLFAASGLSLLTGMVLAAAYALGKFSGNPWLTIPQMLPTHGAINALGFGLLGLLAWHVHVTYLPSQNLEYHSVHGAPPLKR
ncbi:MAG: YndJ family protein [Planctomycetes bacterium]|nr:YndJ family protein [Planctomycetota bacterium]